jgi:hypothetical protein
MSILDAVDQDSILRELGISPTAPGAQAQAKKIADDHLVLDRAMKLLLAEKVPQVLAEMTPQERSYLVKRTGPPSTPDKTVDWVVGQSTVSRWWNITAFGPHVKTPNGGGYRDQVVFSGPPENAHLLKAFGQTVPAEIVKEYKRCYSWPSGEDSAQGALYAKMRAPAPPLDLTVCPGPGFVATSDKQNKVKAILV